MSGRMKWFGLAVILALLAVGGYFLWKPKDPVAYESGFSDFVWITFPDGHLFSERSKFLDPIDAHLRESKAGFVSSALGRGEPSVVEEVELAIDPDRVEAEALIEELKGRGWLPEGFKHVAGSYPRPLEP